MHFIELSVLTLNVWGIPFVSSDREARMSAIASELLSGKYDIVSLQEVWSEKDYLKLVQQTTAVLPYSHYFYSGVIGAGLLVLSKYPIIGTLFHSWSVNGYFHRIQHADWFGGKGVGMCRIQIGEHVINLYNAHLHAEYNNDNDEYKTHRAIQAFDTAQFIEATQGNSILQILAGDLNTKPQDLCYRVLLHTSKMLDSCSAGSSITTNECQRNSYTTSRQSARNPNGIRIDHIFWRASTNFDANIIEHGLPFPERVPGQSYSYSDHEAVLTKFKLGKMQYTDDATASASTSTSQLMRLQAKSNVQQTTSSGDHCSANAQSSEHNLSEQLAALHEAIALCDTSLKDLKVDRMFYYGVAFLIALILIAAVEFLNVPNGFKIFYWIVIFVLFGIMIYFLFMGSIWNFMEKNGILSGKMDMAILLKSIEKLENAPSCSAD